MQYAVILGPSQSVFLVTKSIHASGSGLLSQYVWCVGYYKLSDNTGIMFVKIIKTSKWQEFLFYPDLLMESLQSQGAGFRLLSFVCIFEIILILFGYLVRWVGLCLGRHWRS
jgi:hypothetical protein